MLNASNHWKTLRNWINWGVCRSKLQLLAITVVLPILECIFVNLLTGTPSGERLASVGSGLFSGIG
jgi:hypothetical protein